MHVGVKEGLGWVFSIVARKITQLSPSLTPTLGIVSFGNVAIVGTVLPFSVFRALGAFYPGFGSGFRSCISSRRGILHSIDS